MNQVKTFTHVPCTYQIEKLTQVNPEGGKRYYVDSDGNRYMSVTALMSLDPSKQAGLEKWRNRIGDDAATQIMNDAATRGTSIHSCVEMYLKNQFASEEAIENAAQNNYWMFSCIRPFLHRIDNIRHQEFQLFSRTLRLAGTCDCIAEFDGVPSIIDFKTSLKRKCSEWISSYYMQETAYSFCYEERTGIRVPNLITIIVAQDGSVDVFREQRKDHAKALRDLLAYARKLA